MSKPEQKNSTLLFNRDIEDTIMRFTKFPVIGIFGPSQSGKTTLIKKLFKNYVYLNLQNPEIREFAIQDPKAFLEQYDNEYGIILDEFQYCPRILSYIQLIVDEKNRPGHFILIGSQNYLMNEAVTQSLAGRIGILTLLPLSLNECAENNLLLSDPNKMILKGSYPRLYTNSFLPDEIYPSYIQTYVERDVRQLTNVENLSTFKKFMRLCAGRIGQLLNISDIATNCGITNKTATHWLSILEASYIIFLLQPYHGNFNKRITKTPKLYFYDTGLACSLLGIKESEELDLSPFRGHLFESFIITDLFKQYFNKGTTAPLYFWRDRNGLIEIDCLIDRGGKLTPMEIKSGKTIVPDFFTALNKWNEIAQTDPHHGYIIYGGDEEQKREKGNVVGWQAAKNLIQKI